MAIPGVSVTIRDPGLIRGGPSNLVPLVFGSCSSGTEGQVYQFSSPGTAKDTLGVGPGVEDVLRTLKEGGRPVCFVRSPAATSVADVLGTVTQSGSGPLPTLSGDARVDADVAITILAGGAVGTATFTFSLDGGITTSAIRTTAASFVLPGTGVTVTFTAGTYVAGEKYTFTIQPPHYDATDISALQTTLLAASRRFNFLVFAGTRAASAQVTLFAAISSMLDALESGFKWKRAIMSADAPTDTNDSTVISAWASAISKRISVCHSWAYVPSELGLEGMGFTKAPTARIMGAKQAALLLSTDQCRTDSPITDVLSNSDGTPNMGHDEFVNEAGYDDAQISTLRTWPDRPGVYVTNLRLKSGPSSDFVYFQDGLIMDRAAEIAYSGQVDYVGKNLRTNPDNVPTDGDTGTLAEIDAISVEAYINNKLAADLLRPQNADGFSGHVTAVRYDLDRSFDVQANEGFQGSVRAVKLAVAKHLVVDLGYTRSL